MSEDRIEDLPIFADADPEAEDSAGTWDSATKRSIREGGDPRSRAEPVNLADYSRSPARPRKTSPHSESEAVDRSVEQDVVEQVVVDQDAGQDADLDDGDLRPGVQRSWVDRELDDLTRRARGLETMSGSLDWALVTAFRAQTSNRLAEWTRANPGAPTADQQRQGRLIITDLLDDAARREMTEGRSAWSLDHQDRLADAVFDSVFRLGRLQPLIDDDLLENIEIRGDEPVLVEYGDGILEQREPVADSDQELIEFLAFLGSRSDNERSFSESQPRLHLRLDGGARLAASAWVTPHPIVVIRRHRLVHVSLADLAGLGEFSPLAASFLSAAVKADKSIVVSGSQGAGKTTLLRALCAELPPDEHIGTFETEYELHLHEMPDRHRRVDAFEARPGTGELGIDGRRAGEVTLMELLIDSFRFNERRQIVGEVRGREILAMIKAMQSGAGSMSTTHAKNARAAVDKLVTCALEAGAQVSERYAERAIAGGVDLIVHVNLETIHTDNGRMRRIRRVSEIVAVEWTGDGVAYTDVFKRNQVGELVPGVLPDDYRNLASFGFDLPSYLADGGSEGRHHQ